MITIREYDNTKSPTGAYANFTVLVPGYWDQTKPDPFGEDFAIEINNQADFISKIGKMPAAAVTAIPCQLTALAFGGEPSRTLPEGHTFYKGTESASAGGYLKSTTMSFTRFISDGVGVVTSTDNIYLFAREDDPDYTYAADAFEGNKLGRDAVPEGSYGNQFAYELLGLGYTVLYASFPKLLSAYTTAGNLFEVFADKAAYDFRYIISGFMDGSYNVDAIELANVRQDCTAICDLNSSIYTTPETMSAKIVAVKAAAQELLSGKVGKYTALFANRVTYKLANDSVYTNKTFTCGFNYLACAAKASENFAEWYAVGGYIRGVSPYAIEKLDVNFGDAAVDALQPRNGKDWVGGNANCVNIMIKIKGQYLLWGNSTAETLTTDSADPTQDTLKASHFLNIRQFCTTVKKQVYVACRRLTFDPNSGLLWSNFKGMVEPTLDRAKADQGCDDYLMTKVNNGRKAMMTANIRVVPIEAVKDFDISLFLEDSISGIVIGENESVD